MKVLVTGVAGFIGSHLGERLLADGHEVTGVDCFTDYYPRALKERNLAPLQGRPGFSFVEADLGKAALMPLVDGAAIIYHLAAQAGVRASWGDDFSVYLDRNLWATQRLLEAVRERGVRKFVFASSSSIYGDAERYPTQESDMPRPVSPYGVTKLAGEKLCLAYQRNFGVPIMAMRYFTVYGPRQRPDMAFHRFIRAILEGQEISVYGDGKQTRDFTYVSDAVEATARAGYCEESGEALNIGGGSRVALIDVITMIGEIMGVEPGIRFQEQQKGDVRDTAADTALARRLLDYRPRVSLREGLEREVAYVRELLGRSSS